MRYRFAMYLKWGSAPNPAKGTVSLWNPVINHKKDADAEIGVLFCIRSGTSPTVCILTKVLIKLFQKFAGSRGGAPVAIRRVRPPLIVRRTAGVNHKNAPGERCYERGAL